MSKNSSKRDLMLRTSDANRQSYGGFQWPESGPVEAPDWNPAPVCGGGLHGAARGEGNGRLFNWRDEAVWQVVEYDPAEAVDLGGKIKIPRGVVIYSGRREEATRIIQERYPDAAVIGGTAAARRRGTATAGDYGTATAGDYGTATAGEYGTAMAGDHGTATAGNCGTATAGNKGTSAVGYHGTATAGDYGTATAGEYGTAMAGDHGTATARCQGTATAGDYGTATAGVYGTAAAGDGSTIQIAYYRGKQLRILIGYIGEDGLRPGVRYRVEDGKFVEVDDER